MHRDIAAITGSEEVVRGYAVARLVNELGYRAERLEIERPYEAGRPSTITPRIDIILNDADGAPFLFMEVKAPECFEQDKPLIEGQLFKLAGLHEASTGKKPQYLVYYTVEDSDGALGDKAIIINRAEYATYQEWVDAGEPSIGNTLPANYNKPRRTPLVKGSERDLAQHFTLAEVRALAQNLHNVLWGGGSTGDTEVYSSLVNIILAKIQDEYTTAEGEEYKFQVSQHGDELERPEDLLARVNELYREALRDQLNKTGDLSEQFIVNREKFSPAKVLYTVGQLEKYSLVDGKNSLDGKDILGDFFEKIQREGFKQTKGQFFTPVSIVLFMLYGLEVDKLAIDLMNRDRRLPYLIDPACGSSTFLIEAMRLITAELKRRSRSQLSTNRAVAQRFEELFLPDHHEHKWAREYLYGIEHNFDLATASKVNMILHGDGSSNIFHQDGLKPFRFYEKPSGTNLLRSSSRSAIYSDREVNEQFDVIVSNPPFSVDLDDETKRYLTSEFVFGRKRNSENLFVERYYQILKEGGRLAVILPESVFDTTENKYIRLFMFMYFDVVAIVSLPRVSFEPYTQTKTSVLFARKKTGADVRAWQQAWSEHGSQYGKLRTRVENYIKVHIDGQPASRFPSIRNDDDAQTRANLAAFLQLELSEDDAVSSLPELFEKYRLMIEGTAETDTEANGPFGVVNSRWVLREVTKTLDRRIYAAEAEQVGYKRTKRGVRLQPNDLFDREIAPAEIDRTEVDAAFAEEFERLKAVKASVAARRAEVAGGRASAARERELARLDARISQLDDEIVTLEDNATAIRLVLDRCYQNGKLKPDYTDRTDDELLGTFQLPLMSRWRSDYVVIGRSTPRTILDEMRSGSLWS
jgi:type I restriction enzyme M protein